MFELYSIVANPENSEIFTLLLIVLLCFSYMSFVWGNAKRLGNDLTTFQWGQVYGFGLVLFICAASAFGKLFFPANAEALLSMLRLDGILRYLTVQFQTVALAIIRALM
jgi:hypothetical protein